MEEAELWKGYRNTAEKGKLREPAQAVAVAKCLLARLDYRVGDSHPEPCTMCKIPGGKLMTIYEEWMQWSGLNDPENRHRTLIMFEELPRDVQHQEVRKAQGYVATHTSTGGAGEGTGGDPAKGDHGSNGAAVGEDGTSHQRHTRVDGLSGGVPRGRQQPRQVSVDAAVEAGS